VGRFSGRLGQKIGHHLPKEGKTLGVFDLDVFTQIGNPKILKHGNSPAVAH
jgi:hypothetical protein